ncbi:EsaB/YukD family protein [uncultured Nocardioides sp.]|uniref:EsaB/YukD family protein n=1 Tax=uncultured Nocardioides sp. TaxID=198441 RepID=UPI00261DF8C1|nr:EsaB/YukD family protein [uncultured Nocardioides sp.]
MAAGAGDVLALSVHGPRGVVDLVVPADATVADVAAEYAAQLGLPVAPGLAGGSTGPLDPSRSLREAGVGAGALLVAVELVAVEPAPVGVLATSAERAVPPGVPPGVPADGIGPGPLSGPAPGLLGGLLLGLAALLGVLAGWAGAMSGGGARTATVTLLGLAALVAALPGRSVPHRALLAPVYAGAAAYAVVWEPVPERWPVLLGVVALVSAVAAGVARVLAPGPSEALRVWTVVGATLFVLTTLGTLVGAPAPVVWSVLLVLAVLAPRFVPGLAVDVPDQLLVDLERLSVNAWSARERPVGRRGRTVVPPALVDEVASRGAVVVTAASAGVLAVVVVAAPALLAAVVHTPDVVGARALVLLGGAALLLAARSYRHRAARALLRLAGLGVWVALLVDLAASLQAGAGLLVGASAVAVGLALVAAAVATGRGWRSAWWSRRAEVLEGLVGAFAVAALVPATGLFRLLWENVPDV